MKKAFRDTPVCARDTQSEIDALLNRHGVETIRWTTGAEGMQVEFKMDAGTVVLAAFFDLGDANTPNQRRNQVYRALHWHIKAKLDAVDFGLENMTRAFMPYLITGAGRTLADDVADAMKQRQLGIDVPLLPEGRR